MRYIIIAICAAVAAVPLAGIEPDSTVPAINEVDAWEQVGQQPYEFTWVQRREHPRTLVDFEDLEGWQLELYGKADGEFRRSREQLIWGQYTGKFFYSGAGEESRVIARPPKPIPIPGRFDSIEMWGYGNRWSWVPDPKTPPADVSILIVDARGKEITVQLTDIRWKQWWLIHRKLPPDQLEQIVWPASFAGIEISKVKHEGKRYFFCDSLVFLTEELKALPLQPQPKRNLKPFRGQIAGTNTGAGRLPFPTREETILPSNQETDFQISVSQAGDNRFEFDYKGRDATVKYVYQPKTGALGELTVSVNDGEAFRPMEGGGVRFAGMPEGEAAAGELLSATLDGEVVKAKFRHGSRITDYELQLWQKSLVLDVLGDGRQAAELLFGRVEGVRNPKLITIPYLTYGPSNPRVLFSGTEDKPVFTSIWFDWYRSNASEPFYAAEPKVTSTSAEINNGMRYIAKTNGERNSLYERVFLTNSPVYEETLPTVANPPSLRQREGKQVLWTVTAPRTFQSDHERSRKLRSYGLDKIMQHSHEVTWRDEGDSNTMKLKSSPLKGGDAMLQWYIKAQNDLGWLQGVYSNYTDFCTVNSNWNPDHVQRMPDGEWRRAWPRNYALKPSKAVEFDDYYAQRIKRKFGVKMSYTDVHTAVSPWRYCDFDARVPGAGTFAATFYAYGQLLLNDQRVYGPTQSEATYQWLYAGLESGSYGWVYTKHNLLTEPLDVAFQAMKIHPLEADYGMGYTHYYLRQMDPKWMESPKKREYVDLFLATTIGYGNMGWLVKDWMEQEGEFGVEALARSYYMMQQLQQQYAFVRPKRIEYADDAGKMLTASQAHACGAIVDSRLHVEYDNGTHVYVNRSAKGEWTVKDHEGRAVKLPVAGWLVFNPDNGFYELSAEADGRRIDYVKAPEYEFLDGRGTWTEHGSLGATGSVARRNRGGGLVELIDMYGNNRVAFQSESSGELLAYDWVDKSLGKVEVQSPRGGWYEFRTVPDGRKYVFAATR
ncbi:MAG: hypothetical protein GY953_35050 [bacterium]|nr:hypothetical protein [bacterium]